MAVNLLGSSDARIDFDSTANVVPSTTQLTIALTLRLTAASVDQRRIVSQWGDHPSEQSILLQVVNTDELGFITCNGALAYNGRQTTGLNLANGSLYRIVARTNRALDLNDIWVNGVSESVTGFIGNSTFGGCGGGLASGNRVQLGHETDEAIDGLDADYSEFAIWTEYVPDWFCEAYGKGYAPTFYRPNLILYSPLFNTSHLRDVAGGLAGTNTAGTNATHPSMLYPASGLFSATFEDPPPPLQRITQLVMLGGSGYPADEPPPEPLWRT